MGNPAELKAVVVKETVSWFIGHDKYFSNLWGIVNYYKEEKRGYSASGSGVGVFWVGVELS